MVCKVKPYNGDQPYIFFSYCHADEKTVYPIIEKMTYSGYRIWFDDGVHPGADWPDVIAKKLDGSTLFIAAVSPDSICSHNCKNEMTIAMEDGKVLIPIRLKEFPLPLGIRLQLANTNYINYFDYSEKDFFDKLLSNDSLNECKGDIPVGYVMEQDRKAIENQSAFENHDKPVQEMKHSENESGEPVRVKHETSKEPQNQQLQSDKKQELQRTIQMSKPDVCEKKDKSDIKPNSEIVADSVAQLCVDDYVDDESTIMSDDEETVMSDDDTDETIMEDEISLHNRPIVVRLNTKEFFQGLYPLTSIGRSRNMSDIYFEDAKTVGSHHADIVIHEGSCFIIDHNSKNYTYVNGEKLEQGGRAEITGYAHVSLSRSEPLLIAVDRYADWILDNKHLISLISIETKEELFIFDLEVQLGRYNPWPSGAMKSKSVSREQAKIIIDDTEVKLKDISDKGSYVNGVKIGPNESVNLKDGDNIRFGNEHFIFYYKLLGEGQLI